MTVALCLCSALLASCDNIGEASSEITHVYTSKPNTSSATSSEEIQSNGSEGELIGQGSSTGAVSSSTGTSSSTDVSSVTGDVSSVTGDGTMNRDGDIIFIEGVGYDLLSVVNKNYRMSEDTDAPKLVVLPESTTDRAEREYKADERAAEPLAKFLSAARQAGHNPIVYSAYRTYDYQKNLYEKALNKYINANPGATREDAIKNVTLTAPTGTSEHCIGLAFDIYSWAAYNEFGSLEEGFEDYELCKWLMANAHKYGFILRYPKDKEDITMIDYEPWHYRYVGVEAATQIYEQGLCLEEYTGKLG